MRIFSYTKDKNKEDELVLIFDIGSSSVGGALLKMRKSGIPKIVFAIREPITLEEKVDIDQFLSLATESLDTVAGKIYKAALGAPSKVFCVLSSPWHISQTRVISFKKNTPFIFTPKLAESLIEKEIALFEEEHLAKYGSASGKVRSIEFKNIKTMLNGYETSKPLRQKALELEMTIFISISPEQVLKKIEETVAKYFQGKEIKFSSFTLSSFVVVRDMYIKTENFLLIEIGGEMTDIAMAKGNVLRELVSFPLGRNFIIRGVGTALGSSVDESKSLIALSQDGHTTESVAKKLGPIISKLQHEWLQKFQESLANLTNDISIPSTIYMVVDKDLANFFSKTIETEQFNQYTLTESKFKVIFLSIEVFHDVVSWEGESIRDLGLTINSIYINRLLFAKDAAPAGFGGQGKV